MAFWERLVIALVVPLVAMAVWWCKRYLDDQKSQERRNKARDKLVRAMYAEIDFNTNDMTRFLEKSLDKASLRQRFEEDPDLVPHITDARHTEIYRSRIGDIDVFDSDILHMIVTFYGLLEKIRAQIEGINLPSYTTVSVAGRLNAVEVIRKTAMEAEVSGKELLRRMEQHSPKLNMRRAERMSQVPLEELSERLRGLDARLTAASEKTVAAGMIRR
ncbi:hypothetical protein FHY55_13485 [Oceanicola sp. D3]|uniref:hypothetical protein n=1 Tax=Oceanicola sp. D3 TaxID=2587163 RepID=UPI001122E1D8|nr:hypothetical protein [Oceanicola sp. D3]QDC10198.1 hypothetical protein FHY55_13485 [Oceanicola sp. D3]